MMKNKLVILVLLAAAAALVISHVRLPYAAVSWRMEQPVAADRAGEKMPARPAQGEVDVNRADAEALQALYGIGPALAQEIIDERNANGAFHYPEDLLNVKGIGDQTLKEMQEQLKLP